MSDTPPFGDPDLPSSVYGHALYDTMLDSDTSQSLLKLSRLDTTDRDETDTISIFHTDGRFEGALQPPAYHAYSHSPPCLDTWDDCMQEIERFDWKVSREPILGDPILEEPEPNAAAAHTSEEHESAQALHLEASLDTADDISTSNNRNEVSTRESTPQLTQITAVQRPSAQQTPLTTAAEPDAAFVAPSSPPWIPSPIRPNPNSLNVTASPSVSAAQSRGNGTQYDLPDSENEQKSVSNDAPIATRTALPRLSSDAIRAPELHDEAAETYENLREEASTDKNHGQDTVMGIDQDELCREMEGVTIEGYQPRGPSSPVILPGDIAEETQSASAEKDVPIPSGPPWQRSSLGDAGYSSLGVQSASTEPSDRNNTAGTGEYKASQLPSSDAACGATNAALSRLAGEVEAREIIISDEAWQSRLQKAAAEAKLAVNSKLSPNTDLPEEATQENVPKLSTGKESQPLEMPSLFTALSEEDLANEKMSDLSSPSSDISMTGNEKSDVSSSGMDFVDTLTNGNHEDSLVQHTETASSPDTASKASDTIPSNLLIAQIATSQKRKKPVKNPKNMSDSEQEAPDMKKARPSVSEEAEALREEMIAGTQELGEAVKSVPNKVISKALKSLEEDKSAGDTGLATADDGPATPSRFDRFAHGKYTSPVKHVNGPDLASTKHLEPKATDPPRTDDNDIDMNGHFSDITTAVFAKTPELRPKPVSTPRSRPSVSTRELDALTNSQPRSRLSVSKKKKNVRSGTPTPASRNAFNNDLVALTRSDTPTPSNSTASDADELSATPGPKARAKVITKKQSSGKAQRRTRSTTSAPQDNDHADSADELAPPYPPTARNTKKLAARPKTLRKLLPKPGPLPIAPGLKLPFEVQYGKRHTRGDTRAAMESGGTSAAASMVGNDGGSTQEYDLSETQSVGGGHEGREGEEEGSEFEAETQDDGDDDEEEDEEDEEEEEHHATPKEQQQSRPPSTSAKSNATPKPKRQKPLTVLSLKTKNPINTPASTSKTPTTPPTAVPQTPSKTTSTSQKLNSPIVLVNKFGFRASDSASPPDAERTHGVGAGTRSAGRSESMTTPTAQPNTAGRTPATKKPNTRQSSAKAKAAVKAKAQRGRAKGGKDGDGDGDGRVEVIVEVQGETGDERVGAKEGGSKYKLRRKGGK
ncbi:hypothetical protein J1614_003371 [Plenodomus biglobosus]|nr:hypothetical protein J1614_003371 [Plenodomus biglobosus]